MTNNSIYSLMTAAYKPASRLTDLHASTGSTLNFFMGPKGGITKSTDAQIVTSMLEASGAEVRVLTTDTGNADMVTIGLCTEAPIDLSTRLGLQKMLDVVLSLERGVNKHVVIDIGAGSTGEDVIRNMMDTIDAGTRAVGWTTVVWRPITTSHYSQAHALEFANDIKPDGTACIFVPFHGGGREPEDYIEWAGFTELTNAKSRGAVEVVLQHLWPIIVDNATSFGLTINDVVHGRFSKAGKAAATAKKIFTESLRLELAKWLDRQEAAFQAALVEAVRNVR